MVNFASRSQRSNWFPVNKCSSHQVWHPTCHIECVQWAIPCFLVNYKHVRDLLIVSDMPLVASSFTEIEILKNHNLIQLVAIAMPINSGIPFHSMINPNKCVVDLASLV